MKKLFVNILDLITSSSLLSNKNSINTIHKPESFRKLIEMERNRVHRNDRQFSLILFKPETKKIKPESARRLIKKISSRVRRIDQTGWLDHLHIGVLLPNTTLDGAYIIARDVCEGMGMDQSSFTFEVVCYPETEAKQ